MKTNAKIPSILLIHKLFKSARTTGRKRMQKKSIGYFFFLSHHRHVAQVLLWCHSPNSNCWIDLIELNICALANKSSKQFDFRRGQIYLLYTALIRETFGSLNPNGNNKLELIIKLFVCHSLEILRYCYFFKRQSFRFEF